MSPMPKLPDDNARARAIAAARRRDAGALRGSGPIEPVLSEAWFERALAVAPGGVNSPVRAFRAVGGTPRFMASGSGPWITDVDGRTYLDLVGSWGADDPGSRASGRGRGRRRGGLAGVLVRHARTGRGRAG